MRTSLYALLIILAACSSGKQAPKVSVIHSLLDSMRIAPKRNMMIYTINPDDCISCLNGFKLFDKTLSTAGTPTMYVIATSREVEKQALQREIKYPDLHDNDPSKCVVWDRGAFNRINQAAGVKIPLTMLLVYNYEKDTILYSKPVREITEMSTVTDKLNGR